MPRQGASWSSADATNLRPCQAPLISRAQAQPDGAQRAAPAHVHLRLSLTRAAELQLHCLYQTQCVSSARSAGLNVYLISRTESKLAAAAGEVAAAHGVETNYYAADLAAAGDPDDAGACWFGLRSNLEGLDVGVLVNNAGMSYEGGPELVHALEPKAISALIAINCASLTRMVHLVLPGMKERGRGAIVNVSSGVSAALPACPLLAVYAATKAYVDTLSVSIAAEYAHFGIKVQVRSRFAYGCACACACACA
jgi:NADP-dependent 3-hydroxy acid dehydrogenase YdfG